MSWGLSLCVAVDCFAAVSETSATSWIRIRRGGHCYQLWGGADKSLTRPTFQCRRCNWRTFWRKSAAGTSPRRSCSCTAMPRLNGHLQPRRNWPTWVPMSWSPTLFSASGPVGLPPVPWTEKNNWKVAIFLPTRLLLLRRPGWTDNLLNFFFEWLAKVRATG